MPAIYYAVQYAHIVQSVIIWGGASETRINKIRIAMNKISRVISYVKIYEFSVPLLSSHEMYSELKLLEFEDVLSYC